MVEPNQTKTQEKAEVSSQVKTPYQFAPTHGGIIVLFFQSQPQPWRYDPPLKSMWLRGAARGVARNPPHLRP